MHDRDGWWVEIDPETIAMHNVEIIHKFEFRYIGDTQRKNSTNPEHSLSVQQADLCHNTLTVLSEFPMWRVSHCRLANA